MVATPSNMSTALFDQRTCHAVFQPFLVALGVRTVLVSTPDTTKSTQYATHALHHPLEPKPPGGVGKNLRAELEF